MHPLLPTSASASWAAHLNVLERPAPVRLAGVPAVTLPDPLLISAIRALPAAIMGLILTKAGGS